MNRPGYPGDRARREQAARVEEVFPGWLVMWGPYTRQFWAFPRFAAPAGTIAQAADATALAGIIRRMQRAVTDG